MQEARCARFARIADAPIHCFPVPTVARLAVAVVGETPGVTDQGLPDVYLRTGGLQLLRLEQQTAVCVSETARVALATNADLKALTLSLTICCLTPRPGCACTHASAGYRNPSSIHFTRSLNFVASNVQATVFMPHSPRTTVCRAPWLSLSAPGSGCPKPGLERLCSAVKSVLRPFLY